MRRSHEDKDGVRLTGRVQRVMVKTCSECAYYRADPQNLQQGACYYNPPAVYPIPTPDGRVSATSVRPCVGQNDPACGHGQPKVLA